jgi:heat-inducible transcriptional repressor
MKERKEKILNAIIREHIRAKAPVGSGAIAEKYNLDISSATIRNVMGQLEEEGYITQPYTSAGRVPTVKAYKEYVHSFSETDPEKFEKRLNRKEKNSLDKAFSSDKDRELLYKDAAKVMARISDAAVFWAFHQYNMYYTGISNLISQPEFSQRELIYDISSIIDRMDEIVNDNFENFSTTPQILLGEDNPFGIFCGTIITKYKMGSRQGLVGILAPMRMDYKKNYALINYVLKHITHNLAPRQK